MWENPPYGIFWDNQVCNIFQKLYLRTNFRRSLSPIARFVLEIEHMYDLARTIEIDKSQPKALLRMCVVFPYSTHTCVFNYHDVFLIRAEQLETNAMSYEPR